MVKPLFYSMTDRTEQAMMKLVVDGNSDRVLSARMVSESATEIVQTWQLSSKKGRQARY
jgi:glutathione reductase (NADPH)